MGWGRVKKRFAILKSGLRVPLARDCNIILACCILHNISVDLNQAGDFDDEEDDEDEFEEDPYPLDGPLQNYNMRNKITNEYFVNYVRQD